MPIDQGLHIDPSLVLQETFRPSIVTWNRLEPRPRREDFDRSLRAEVRDALWLLCRQWQFGEFRGEDGGSAVRAKVAIETARLDRYASRGREAVPYDDRLPLEVMVEREPIPLDLATRIQIGGHWLKLLAPRQAADHRGEYVREFGFLDPTDPQELAHLRADQRARQLFEAARNRAVDGARLLAAIRSGAHAAFVAASGMSAADQGGALAAATELLAWLGRLYSQPGSPEEDAWAPSHLEYQFVCAADADPTGSVRTVLTAEQYHHGHLDWYSFDLAPEASLPDRRGEELEGGRFRALEPIAFVPAPIEFAGMPNARWWELEHGHTNFGSLSASTSELALLFLAEFDLIYGNDWSLLPFDLEVGSLAQVKGIVVTDVFGVRTLVRPAGRGPDDDWQRWTVYSLSRAGTGGEADLRLFLPPAIGKLEESAPIERVVLARDEMANMVWGIEETIPGVIGAGVDGYEAATDLVRFSTPAAAAATGRVESEASIRYRVGTSVPENWIPFLPVRAPGSNRDIRLQRAAMPRLTDEDPDSVVTPRGALLRPGLDLESPEHYFVHPEEVPRSGATLTRTFQRTRWWDGRTYVWLGRRKQTGRGEGSSGLAFDIIVPKET